MTVRIWLLPVAIPCPLNQSGQDYFQMIPKQEPTIAQLESRIRLQSIIIATKTQRIDELEDVMNSCDQCAIQLNEPKG